MSYSPNAPIPSTENSTTTPLAAFATFTGDWEEAPRSMVLVQVFSDVGGTLYFDFSTDGVNADSTFPASGASVTGGAVTVQPAAVGGRYFRVRYANNAAPQATFRLGTYFSEFNNFYAPLNQAYNLQSPAILTRSTPPWLDVSRELATGVDNINKFGRNASVGTTFVPVAFSGIYNTPQSGSATTLRIKAGGNANDTVLGTGARVITLEGLDENFELATEAIATAGASASSATTTTFTRLFRVYVTTSGTYATTGAGSHAGDIVIENGSGGTDWATIDSTGFPKAQSEIGAYSVATGYTAYVFLIDITVDSGKTVDAIFFQRQTIDETSAPYSALRAVSVLTGLTGGITKLDGTEVPLGPFTGPCDLLWLAKVSTGTGSVSVEFEIILVQE